MPDRGRAGRPERAAGGIQVNEVCAERCRNTELGVDVRSRNPSSHFAWIQSS
jgi:hypothetical protein